MIIWLTGQPFSGKTTLSQLLELRLDKQCIAVYDGDDVRKGTNNFNYSQQGRIENILNIQKLASTADRPDKVVIVAAVAPYRYLREKFKKANNVKEIYLFKNEADTNLEILSSHYVEDYEPPLENCLYINTKRLEPEHCLYKIMKYCDL
jgi:adenylylsulfate kinase-like enzyme